MELEVNDSKKYKIEAIQDNVVYASKLQSGQLPDLYYLVAWKRYLKEESTWKPLSAIQYLKKLISCFHKEYSEKPTATSLPIDSASPMARPIVRPTPLKRKQG